MLLLVSHFPSCRVCCVPAPVPETGASVHGPLCCMDPVSAPLKKGPEKSVQSDARELAVLSSVSWPPRRTKTEGYPYGPSPTSLLYPVWFPSMIFLLGFSA